MHRGDDNERRPGVDEVANFATHMIIIVPLFAPDRSPIGCLQVGTRLPRVPEKHTPFESRRAA
jgi:hypothetical protein